MSTLVERERDVCGTYSLLECCLDYILFTYAIFQFYYSNGPFLELAYFFLILLSLLQKPEAES